MPNFSIWEPEEGQIEEDDAKPYLEEAQLLCDRITEVEKSFASKPLQTIPLPKPLEEFTWFSLAKNVTFLHQYIKDQEMVNSVSDIYVLFYPKVSGIPKYKYFIYFFWIQFY